MTPRRTPLPSAITQELCDPCEKLRAEKKLMEQFVASLMEMLGTTRAIVTVDPTAKVHYLPTESGAFEVTSD